MTLERELRSSKRQRMGPTGQDVSLANSDSLGQVNDHRKQEVQSEVDETHMLDSKAQKCALNKDFAKASVNDGKDKCFESSEEDRRQTGGLGQSDVTKGIMSAPSFKKERCTGSTDGLNELFPEHNEKLADTLLSLRGMNVSPSKIGPLTKADDDLSKKANGSNPPARKKTSLEVSNMRAIEIECLHKLEKYIHANGGTIGDGWKIQATRKHQTVYKSYISPEGRRLRSMKEVARFLGVLPNKKGFTGPEEDSDHTEPKAANGNGSVYLNTVVSQVPQVTGDLEPNQIHEENANWESFARMSPKVMGSEKQHEVSAPLMEHFPNQGCNSSVKVLVEPEMQPSSRLSTTAMKGKNPLDATNTPNGHEGTLDTQHGHWAEILKQVKTSNMNVVGVGSCILRALASEPPEWAREMLQQLIVKDVPKATGSGLLKEAVLSVLARYDGEEMNNEQAEGRSILRKSDQIAETSKAEEGTCANEPGGKNTAQKALPSSEMITECCRSVLQDIISAEQFGVLCNLMHGSFVASRTHEVFDFRLIDLRMNAGTYGMSPGLFDSDMQQIWKRVRQIGQEMVILADGLTQCSQAAYEKQVSILLKGDSEKSPKVDHVNMAVNANINRRAMEQEVVDEEQQVIDSYHGNKENTMLMKILRDEDGYGSPCTTPGNLQTGAHTTKIMDGSNFNDLSDMPGNVMYLVRETKLSVENVEGSVDGCSECKKGNLTNVKEVSSSGVQCICKSCGRNERSDCIILCNTCEAAYHMYCVLPALEDIPSCNWQCSSCTGAAKELSEVHSFNDKKKSEIVKEDTKNVARHYVASKQPSVQMALHSTIKNDECDIDREQVEFVNAREEVGHNNDRECLQMHNNAEESDLHSDGKEMDVHVGRQEVGLCEEKREIPKLCKICRSGQKDDDDLIECSNANCFYVFYHLRCLRPPLASIPPPTWYCPSCLCRSCFIDENDAEIVLCDGCDDGYHTYCLKPPLVVIPKSNWYCSSCLDKQKRMRRKKSLSSGTSKSMVHVRSKKGSRLGSPPVHIGTGTDDITERDVGPVAHAQSKKASKAASPSLPMGSALYDLSDKNVDHEMGSSSPDLQSKKPSHSASSAMEEEAVREAPSDGSDGATEKFIIRVRSKQTSKFLTGMKSKEAGKRKRKCSEPRRSQV